MNYEKSNVPECRNEGCSRRAEGQSDLCGPCAYQWMISYNRTHSI